MKKSSKDRETSFNGSMVQWFNGSMVQWFNVSRLIMLFIVINCFTPTSVFSSIQALPTFLTLSNFSVTSDSIITIGDTLTVQFELTSVLNDSATVLVHASKGIHILNNDSCFYRIKYQTDTITAQDVEIQFIVDSLENSFFSIYAISDFNSIEFENSISTSLHLQKDSTNSFLILNDQFDNIDETIKTIQFNQTSCPQTPSHQIKVKGRVTFLDKGEINENYKFYANNEINEEHPRRKSPRTTAWIFFRNSSNPNNLTHPIPFDASTGLPIEGKHFAKCEEGTNFNQGTGEFTFDFYFNPASVGCSSSQDMTFEIYIAKENEAMILNSGSDNIIISNLQNPFYANNTNLKLYPTKYYSKSYSSNIPNIDISYNSITQPVKDLDIEIPFDEGATFRYITLSREYLKELYNNSLLQFSENRNVPQSNVFLEWEQLSPNNNENPGGDYPYYLGRTINIYKYYGSDQTLKDNYSNIQNISHEFGHFFDCRLTKNFHNEEEAFAMFFSYATRVWIYNTFGDYFTTLDDCEIGPFCNYTIGGSTKVINLGLSNEVEYNRYGNMSKMGVPDINSCRFACYLWNIYDSKSDQPYSPIADWDGKANDDVEDLRTDLMDFYIEYPIQGNGFQNFHNLFKAEYDENTNLQNSIQSIFDFMDFKNSNDYSNPLIENINARMKSPDLSFENAIGLYGNQVKFYWNNIYSNVPFEYEYSMYNPVHKEVYQFSNKDSEVKVEKQTVNEGDWILLEEIEDCVENTQTDWYEIPNNVIYLKYKLSEINPVTSSVIHDEIFDFGIPDDKINRIIEENVNNNFELGITNNLLSIHSKIHCSIQNIKIYNVLGKLIDEISTNKSFSNYHEIKLNSFNCIRNLFSIIQITYLDSNLKQNVSYLKLINY